MIRALVVDDEGPARSRLRRLLEESGEFEIVGECANGEAALAAIAGVRPDVVFLDIRMPKLSGFDVCARLADAPPPEIVFVTAFDRFALQAFEVHAVDYLLKPFDEERFAAMIANLKRRLARGADAAGPREELRRLVAELRREPATGGRLVYRCDGRVVFIAVDEIDRVEGDGNYLRIHAGRETYHVRETLQRLLDQLPGERFVRINRSEIVNMDRVKEMQALFHGDYTVVLKDGTKRTLSRNYRQRFEEFLR